MRILAITLSLVVATGLLLTASGQDLDVELQRAMQRAVTTGDLDAAIDEYRDIAARAGSNRGVGAQALIRMGQAYETLGRPEARDAYERVLRDYADQGETVAEARARLAAFQQPATVIPASALVVRRIAGPIDLTGSPSGDGRYLSTTDYRTGDVAVVNVATGQIRALTGQQPTRMRTS